ncbi:hypothetical protein ACFY3U_07085 [Micromonospora sp. NPDC000089]|uniref:hypothetical protein n=1 Tax=unclassified Micromonospora TaxID=2617518 RepID=UPI00368BEF95
MIRPRVRAARLSAAAVGALLLGLLPVSAGVAHADDVVTWYVDGNGNPTLDDPGTGTESDPVIAQSVDPGSSIIGTWYSSNGAVLRFDANNGYAEQGAPCPPPGNVWFRSLRPLGVNVFGANGVSSWSEDYRGTTTSTCTGTRDWKYQNGYTLTVNGNTLTISGSGAFVGTLTRAVFDRPAEGYLDGCNVDVCWGWARDADFGGAVDVHFYADYPAGQGGQFIGAVTANQPAEPAVGGAHRFTFAHGIAVPGGDRQIYAYAIGRNPDGSGSGANPLLLSAPAWVPARG